VKMDNPLSPDKTETSQAENMNSSENKDNVCNNEEISVPQEKRLDEAQLDKNTEEVYDETAMVTSDKDPMSSNVGASDSATCLTTISENDNAEAEVSSKESNDTIKEVNVVKSFCEENTSANINKKITKLSVPNLMEKCVVQHLPSENSCEVTRQDSDNTKGSSTKSASENITNVLETLATESSKDCDVPDESSVNADDVQISRKDTDSSKKVESESSDSNSENPDKDPSEKNVEPENTEFVQFSHDKHDDPQIENQSVDAVDPFGGDNLTNENVEQMETDSFAEDEVSFKNLYDQDDNLQHAVNVRSNEHSEKLNIDCTLSDSKDVNKDTVNSVEVPNNTQTNIDSLESTPMNTDIPDIPGNIEIEAANTSSTKLSNEQNKQTKKNITEEITSIETDEEQTDVLPGQDDELCIIPDSMKVIIPNKPGKAVSSEQNGSTFESGSKHDETTQKSSSGLDKSTQDELEAVIENKNNDSENLTTIRNEYSLTAEDPIKAADVINIDDESKNSEVEEITSKEICKQCGEEKACKIRVKIGAENYHVCSKTCKALFKTANNKAVDIPSDGPSSKCEKRCATCLSVIEANDERNLSWETMEFCNEECLGKFQRKYGSYCKNCNGTVQAVSLGKYCVRFGCDVRQFCCSTCLEEFKKGLKVCSYCQKDISFSTDGFLAPVGEKGQFKDFCTQDCMEKYSKLNSTEPPATEKKLCSVCKQV